MSTDLDTISAKLGRIEDLLGEYMDALERERKRARDAEEDYRTAMSDLAESEAENAALLAGVKFDRDSWKLTAENLAADLALCEGEQ